MPLEVLKAKIHARVVLSLIMVLTILMTACGDTSTPTIPVPATMPPTINSLATATNNSAPATTTSIVASVVPATASATTAVPASTTALPTTLAATATTAPVTATPPVAASVPAWSISAPMAQDEKEVNFTAGKDLLYATLLVPNDGKTGKKPAILIVPGAGPFDRNGSGDPAVFPAQFNTYLNLTRVLADQGVISLRYDKLGTGKTGQASYASHPHDIDYNLYIDEAHAAYDYLKSRPEVDSTRLLILGHSEGGLTALVLADQLKSSGGPKALVLAVPQSRPILELIRRLVVADYAARVKNGTYTQADADEVLAEYDSISKTLLETGKLPEFKNLVFRQIFPTETEKYIAQQAKYDPIKIAAGLPITMPVLLICGEKDSSVSCNDVKMLSQGFENAGNKNISFNQIANMNHLFKDIPGEVRPFQIEFADMSLKYSTEFMDRLTTFVKTKL